MKPAMDIVAVQPAKKICGGHLTAGGEGRKFGLIGSAFTRSGGF